ncbi:MAG: ATP-binding cassette domain-containing protein [Lachnospiraceae bacterium]|nr:ATP-binding cassette domain-containing protein [Lachnospiraceae bacterium]
MNRENEQQLKHNASMFRIMMKLLEVDNLDEALHGALETIIEELQSELGAIWLLDEETGRLRCVFSEGEADLSFVTVENGVGAEGHSTLTGESVTKPVIEGATETDGCIFDDMGEKTETLLCVPLKSMSKIIGCIIVANRKTGGMYSGDELDLLEKMAALAGMTIEEKGLIIPRTEHGKVIISLRDITKEYPSGDTVLKVLKGINLDIYENEFVVVLGESGCGKSTMMNIIGGMDYPTSGTLYVEGKDYSHPTEKELTEYRRNYLGFIFQSYNLMPNLTAKENIQFIAEISRNPLKPEEALKLVGLESRADNYPSQMSGGQQQRVSIARALVKNPKMILADEPTAALDFETGQEVLKVLEKIIKEKHTTVIMITHNVEIAKMANRVVKLRSGKISSVKTNINPLPAEQIIW